MHGPNLSIIVPTYNESGNIEELIAKLNRTIVDISWEVIFVDDDSPDGTADLIARIANTDSRIRCIRRIGRRGLSTACIEGMASSSAQFVAVMDADLQHDEALLPQMLIQLQSGAYDIAVGSRYVTGGSVGNWNKNRKLISRIATVVAQKLIRCPVADPMSGFFMLPRIVFLKCVHRLSGQGFKILLDILASSPQPLRFVEIPFHFRLRQVGESKLDSTVSIEFGFLLIEKLFGRYFPIRFIIFSLVGASGVVVHLLMLSITLLAMKQTFTISQCAATAVALVYNFFINNSITYRGAKLKGIKAARGLLIFSLVCSIGAFTNIQVSRYLYQLGAPWWLSGLIGIVIVSVWNYTVTSQLVWKERRS